jgi:hypothetical protein
MRRSIVTAVAVGLISALLPASPASADGPAQKFVTVERTLQPGVSSQKVTCNEGDGTWEAVSGEVGPHPGTVFVFGSFFHPLTNASRVFTLENNEAQAVTVKLTVRCVRPLPTRGSGNAVVLEEKSSPVSPDQTIVVSVMCPDGTVPGGIGWSADKAGSSTGLPPGNPAFQWRSINEAGNADTVRVESFAPFSFDFVLHVSCLHRAVKVGGQPAVLKIQPVAGSSAVNPGVVKNYGPSCPAGDVPMITEFKPVTGNLLVIPFVVPMTTRADPTQIYNGTSTQKTVNEETDCLKHEVL